jgi:hypothetical protein
LRLGGYGQVFVGAAHAPVEQIPPAQQSCPVRPQAAQRPDVLSQTKGSPQKLPPLGSLQHVWPTPPQGTQLAALHLANGEVHATLPAQHASPILPHAPA